MLRDNGNLNVTNCHNEGNISGSNNAGGIAGYTNGTINLHNCYNTGEITNNLGYHTGGLIGRDNATTNNTTITNSYNAGKVNGQTNVGGIMGRNFGSIEITDSHNEGDVTSLIENVTSNGVYVGGILGRSSTNSKITKCYNIGNITSNATYTEGGVFVAGIISRPDNKAEIINCYNEGNITNGTRAGGIIGEAFGNATTLADVKIINTYNSGKIETTTIDDVAAPTTTYRGSAGGIGRGIYYGTLTLINCYNTADVTANYQASGITIFGTNHTINIINCYNQGNIESTSSFARGIVNSSSGIVSNVYNTGTVTGATSSYAIAYSDTGETVITNAYFLDNIANGAGGTGITSDPATKMTQAQMQASSFVDTLNANKNSINLAAYGLSDYTLSSWKTGTSGYPEFDW